MEFIRRKAQSLEHGPIYVHELVVEGMNPMDPTAPQSPFSIIASKSGLRLKGTLDLPNQPALRAFAKLISDAQKDADKLKPNLSTNLAGH